MNNLCVRCLISPLFKWASGGWQWSVDYPLCILKSFLSCRVVGSHRVMGTLQYSDKWSREQISKTFCQVNVFRSALFPRNTFHNVWLCCLVKKDIIFWLQWEGKRYGTTLQKHSRNIYHQLAQSTSHNRLFVCPFIQSFICLFVYSFVEATALLKYLFWSCINKLHPLLCTHNHLFVWLFVRSFVCLFVCWFILKHLSCSCIKQSQSTYFVPTISHYFTYLLVYLFIH